MCQWTHDEMRDNLLWCLGGKACDFYINTVAINSNISFDDVVAKLEKRFHFPVLEKMALLQLENSEQLPHESLEDWADRVLQMAQNAYKSLHMRGIRSPEEGSSFNFEERGSSSQ